MTEPGSPKPRRRGCLFYGCLSGVACLLIILVAFLFGLYQLKKFVNFYTDTHPVALPSVQMSPAEIDQLKQRVENFQDAVRSGRPTEPLAVTAEEINAFLQNDANYSAVKGKLYVSIEGDRLKGQVSVPLEEMGWRIFRGRYFNGTGIFSVAVHNGTLFLTADSLVVKGRPLPSIYMEKIRSQNLAENLNNNPRASVAINHLQEVRISDGKLILVPKVEQ
jgi:hypothetical protein